MNKYECLKLEHRKIIERMYNEGATPTVIANYLGKSVPTIYRELERGKTEGLNSRFRPVYSAEVAETRVNQAYKNRGRRKAAI